MNNSLTEDVIHIAMNAGYMVARGQIDITNSSEFTANIIDLAVKFEIGNINKDDYLNAIDSFSEKELIKLYNIYEV